MTEEKTNEEKAEKAGEGPLISAKSMEILIAQLIPTSKYFEVRFDHMQEQINGIKSDLKDFRGDVDKRFSQMQTDMDKRFSEVRDDMDKRFSEVRTDMNQRFEQVDKRFEQVDKRFVEVRTDMDQRFEQVDKRFEQVDKRFEQVDKRFEQIIASIDRLGDKLDHRDENQRRFTIRLFTIAIGISVFGAGGAFLKAMGVF